MLYAPISPSDLSTIKGLGSSLAPVGSEVVAGHEGVGVVKEVGSGVAGLKAGQLVVPTKAGLGTWSRKVVAQEGDVAAVPAEIDAAQAASMLSGTACALGVIGDFKIRGGETVILDNANGPLGLPFVQVACKKGIKVVCLTSGSVDYASTAKALGDAGALAVIDESFAEDESFQSWLEQQVPKYAIRSGGSQLSARIMADAVSKNGGILVMVDGAGPLTSPSSAKVERWDLGASIGNTSPKDILAELTGPLKQKVEVFNFDHFDHALKKVLSRSVDGSVLLKF